MPHIIVEYTEQLAEDVSVGAMLRAVHHAVAESGLFEAGHIKTRAYPFREFTNGGGNDPYIHVQARIKSGRDTANKKRFAGEIIAALSIFEIPASVITVEVIDMDRESYAKHAQDI